MFYNTLQNAIINGGFNFFQRGTSFAAIAASTYFADRFKYDKTGTMVHTISRSTDIPAGAISNYSALATVTTAQAVLGVTDKTEIETYLEGNFVSRLYGKKCVLAFWVRSAKIGTYCIRLANSAQDRVLVKEYSIATANVWERKIIRFTLDNVGTWLKDSGKGLEVGWVLAAGTSNNMGTEGVWGANANVFSTINQVNFNDTVGATFQLAEVVLVEDNMGATRIPNFVLAGRDYAEELSLCQRYFEKSYELDTPPATATVIGTGFSMGCNSAGTSYVDIIWYIVSKRVVPTVAVWSGSGVPNNNGRGAVTQQSNGTNRATYYGIGSADSTSQLQFTADSDF